MRANRILQIGMAATTVAVQLAATGGPAAAADDHDGSRSLSVLSGHSPFAEGCPDRRRDAEAIAGAEIEPAITADPRNPRRIVATWQQDIGGIASRSDLIASTVDGGESWTTSTIPGLTVCTGGTADFASDPWLSTGGDGTVYFSGTTGESTAEPPAVAVVTTQSRDGGRTWEEPTTIAAAEPGNDTDAITADPSRAGHAYLVWANWDHSYQPPMTNALRFSRTSDHGAHWSPPVTIHQPEPTAIDFSGHILVLPGGELLAVFASADIVLGQGTLLASRSLDKGRTWQPAVEIGSRPVGFFTDPETGVELPQPGFPSSVVAPDGIVYVASEASSSPAAGAVSVARSDDGGVTWTSNDLPGVTAFAFEPAIAVDAHGALGIIWYDLRRDRPRDAELTTDVWFAASRDQGATWRQRHLAGPFDLLTAPNHRLGEYQGIAGLCRGFAAVFTVAASRARNGPSDILFARVEGSRR
jgi:hypothetical protein